MRYSILCCLALTLTLSTGCQESVMDRKADAIEEEAARKADAVEKAGEQKADAIERSGESRADRIEAPKNGAHEGPSLEGNIGTTFVD